MADPAMRELYKQWYPLDTVPVALEKIGRLVVAGKESHAASYAEIQLQSAHDRIGELAEEVERLRAALELICAVDPDEKPDGTILGYLRHDVDEMAGIARKALAGESLDE